MSKHTPGPWEIQRYKGFTGFSVWAKDRGCIAERWHSNAQDGAYIEELQANARLIAAAPELLKELQNVINQAEANPFLAVGMLVEHHSKIRQVLAKAEGRDE